MALKGAGHSSDSELIQEAFLGAHHDMVLRASWVFLPMVMVNFASIAMVVIDKAPWWVVFPIPLAAVAVCGYQIWHAHKTTTLKLTPADYRATLERKGNRAVLIAVALSAWGIAVAAYAPQLMYFIAAVSGFTAIGSVAYVAYLQGPMRLILGTVGIAMLVVVLVNNDYATFVVACCYASTALLLDVYVSTNSATFSSVVIQHLESQSKYQDSKRAQAEISRIANTDHLTGVMNRRGFLAEVEKLIEARQQRQTPFAIGVIDLDGFKPVNDCYGHAAGDQVLTEIARRLTDFARERGTVARLGGDEFAVLFPYLEELDDLTAIGQSAIASLTAPITVSNGVAHVSASCGLAIFPEAGTTSNTLLEHADEALYAAKRHQRSSTAVYDKRNQQTVLRRSLIEQRLRRAIDSDELYLEYQPIVDSRTGQLLSYEALARWHDAEAGMVSPAEFIPIAETCGLIGSLSSRLLRQALQTAATWPDDVMLSFNASPANISDNTLVVSVLAALHATKFPPKRLTLELTETAFAESGRVREMLESLRQIGVRIAMDDFGVGYSSFANLDRLPVDVLKLDRSFIADVANDERRRHIVAAIVEMAQRLGLSCVAEGIEDKAQLDFVAQTGCKAAQGYLIGRPARSHLLTHIINSVAV